jgi:hypothetical protein
MTTKIDPDDYWLSHHVGIDAATARQLRKSAPAPLLPHVPVEGDLPLDMDEHVPHGRGPLSRTLLRAIRAGAPIATIAGYRIYAVDGVAVRNLVHVDFTTGGNPGRYSYVPEGEVWIERVLEPADAAASLLHEMVETVLMQETGLDYDAGHEEASNVETMLRAQLIWTPGEARQTLPEAAAVAGRWFHRWARARGRRG